MLFWFFCWILVVVCSHHRLLLVVLCFLEKIEFHENPKPATGRDTDDGRFGSSRYGRLTDVEPKPSSKIENRLIHQIRLFFDSKLLETNTTETIRAILQSIIAETEISDHVYGIYYYNNHLGDITIQIHV